MINPLQNEIAQILKQNKVIAVVGLSNKVNRASHGVSQYMINHGYHIIPVNPNYKTILGLESYKHLGDIAQKVDIVNIFRRSSEVMPIVEQAIEISAKVIWMQLGVVDQQAAELASKAGLTVIMDKCIKIEHAHLL